MSEGFGIYIHWPYCAAKCPYCDFNSHVRARYDETRWANAILGELESLAALQDPRPEASSIFFGGGTPSLMSGAAVRRVLDGIAKLWALAPDAEITLEANPGSAEQERFRDYRAAGVNRISVGAQSFDDAALKCLGRIHGAEEARRAIRLASDIFPRVSFDLIYARPDQSAAAWKRELEEALSFKTEHLSVYQLTIEKGTHFETLARLGQLVPPAAEAAAGLYELTQELCAAAGLPAYEISNHARPGAAARHNLLYWRYGDYAGAGPGAHGRLSVNGKRIATKAERLPERWLEKIETAGTSIAQEEVAPADGAREHLLMALRLREGLPLSDYETRWTVTLPRARIAALCEQGYVTLNHDRLAATPKGRLVLDRVIAEIAP